MSGPGAPLRLAYNTNGLQSHRLVDALDLLVECGYHGVALTPDAMHADVLDPGFDAAALARALDRRSLGCVVETGARFVLDPRRKHEPNLLSREPEGRARRVDFLRRCVDLAAELEAECVSFWAGPGRVGAGSSLDVLADGVEQVLDHAERRGVEAALEPEPGHLVETLEGWRTLRDRLGDRLRLALDVGHLLVTGEGEPAEAIRAHAADLATVTVEDMRRGEHVHLPFGEGDLDLPPVVAALREIGWRRLVCVELSRDSHRAHETVPAAIAALRAAGA